VKRGKYHVITPRRYLTWKLHLIRSGCPTGLSP
jgi:hypothetical protein